MKGLDSWIMGLNDPDAPFNQQDWVDFYEPILDKCYFITDEVLDNDEAYMELENIFAKAVNNHMGDKFIPRKQIREYLIQNRDAIIPEIEKDWKSFLEKSKIIFGDKQQ